MSEKTCSFDGCDKKIKAFNLCPGHYSQMKRGSEMTPLRRLVKGDLLTRLDAYTDKTDSCWNWTGATGTDGYGRLNVSGGPKMAHRVAFLANFGTIPTGQTVHHKCANILCVRPDHLELATKRQNVGEMFARKAYEARIAELEARVAELEGELQ